METSYVKEVKRNFRGNLLNYISFLEKEKSGSAQSTASLYKVTLGHLERFVGTDILKMKQVTPLLVKDFVSYLQYTNIGKVTLKLEIEGDFELILSGYHLVQLAAQKQILFKKYIFAPYPLINVQWGYRSLKI